MTKHEALSHFGGNGAACARALNISVAAVSQWADDAIPEAQALRLKYEVLPKLKAAAKKRRPAPAKAA